MKRDLQWHLNKATHGIAWRGFPEGIQVLKTWIKKLNLHFFNRNNDHRNCRPAKWNWFFWCEFQGAHSIITGVCFRLECPFNGLVSVTRYWNNWIFLMGSYNKEALESLKIALICFWDFRRLKHQTLQSPNWYTHFFHRAQQIYC